MFLHREDSSLPTSNRSSKGKAFVQECQTPGNRSLLPLSSLGVAGTAHPVSSADRGMEPSGGLALLVRSLGTKECWHRGSALCLPATSLLPWRGDRGRVMEQKPQEDSIGRDA